MVTQLPAWLLLDRNAGDLERQIRHAIRDRILNGRLKAGDVLPSSRTMATSLGVARSTVTGSYERLKAEGFIQSSRGAAPQVASLSTMLPDTRPRPLQAISKTPAEPERFLPFRPGLPDLSSFPGSVWARCLAARSRSLRVHDLGYSGEAGLPELRQAIITHVVRTRAVLADPEQVIVMPSAAAIIGLLARLSLGSLGRPVWMEDPGYINAREIFRAARRDLVPIPATGMASQSGAAADRRPP